MAAGEVRLDADLDPTAAGIKWAREGAPLNQQQAYVLSILELIYTALPEARALFASEGHILREGELFRDPDLADALERFGAEGPDSIYTGETAADQRIRRSGEASSAPRTWPHTRRSAASRSRSGSATTAS